MRYLATHRALLATYLRTVSFHSAKPDIYASSMSALCSSYPEILENTAFAVGISTDFEAMKKDCHWHNQTTFQ